MKLRSFVLLLAATLGVVPALFAARPVSELYHKQEFRIPMRDSVRLYTAVYAPLTDSAAPILIFRTPYSCSPYGADHFPSNLESGYLRSYIDRGYILVMQDVRGRYMSEGDFEQIRPAGEGPTDESTDSYDTVDWLVHNLPHNNGRVGFAGSSYPGFYAMKAALCGHPAIRAVSPQAPVADWFMGDDVHHNGVLMLADSYRFLSGMNTPSDRAVSAQQPSMGLTTEPDEWSFFMQYTSLAQITQLMGDNKFWSEMSSHPNYDSWWQARDLRRAVHNVRPAVLVVGGTFDAEDCFGAWNLYRTLVRQSPSTASYLVVGPWAHGAWRNTNGRLGAFDFGPEATWQYYTEHFELPFFDHYLLTQTDDERAEIPAVSVFTSGDNRWHSFGRWLPHDAKKLTFYLATDGSLTPKRSSTKKSARTYTSDPSNPVPYIEEFGKRRPKEYMVADQRFVANRPDVLTYLSEPLDEPLTLMGPVDVALEVAISTTDADFVVKLIDVYPQSDSLAGYQMLVRGDIMRGRYRQSFSRPEAFKPGVATQVPFRMTDIAHTFGKGHRLAVQVQSTWFPLAERNPQQAVDVWHCSAEEFIPSQISILCQRSNSSSVTVWQLKTD